MALVRDPVCGMEVDTDEAVASSEHGGTRFYFCSEACQEQFEQDPEQYVREEQE